MAHGSVYVQLERYTAGERGQENTYTEQTYPICCKNAPTPPNSDWPQQQQPHSSTSQVHTNTFTHQQWLLRGKPTGGTSQWKLIYFLWPVKCRLMAFQMAARIQLHSQLSLLHRNIHIGTTCASPRRDSERFLFCFFSVTVQILPTGFTRALKITDNQ